MTRQNLWDTDRPEVLGPRRQRPPGVKFDAAFRSSAFFTQHLLTEARAIVDIVPPAIHVDVCTLYELSSTPEADPSLFAMWRAATVDGATVYIQSPKAAVVSFSVASALLTPGCRWRELRNVGAPDPNQLLRALLPLIFDSFVESEAGQSLVAQGYELSTDVVRHKKPSVDLDTGRLVEGLSAEDGRLANTVTLQYAGSDRPAFVIRATKEVFPDAGKSMGKEILHLYPAMSLTHQHWTAQILLARCYDHDLAVSVLSVVRRCLGCICPRTSITATASPGWEPSMVHGWVDDFWGRLLNKSPDMPETLEGAALEFYELPSGADLVDQMIEEQNEYMLIELMQQLLGGSIDVRRVLQE